MLAAYRGLTGLAAPLIDLYLADRARRGKEDARRIDERRGLASLDRPSGSLIWLHAASVGEAQALIALVRRLIDGHPDRHVLITTGTVTSAELLLTRLPPRTFHQFVPVDRVAWVRRFLDHWRPQLAVWMQSELWPNLVTETAAREVPMALINARLSARSFARWRRLPGVIGPLIEKFALCLTVNEEQAARWRGLGAAAVNIVGDLKFAAAPLPVDPVRRKALADMIGQRRVWLAASTHDGEEAAALEVHRRLTKRWTDLLTIVVPRHPTRGDEIAMMLSGSGIAVARRSKGEPVTAATGIYLADTLGELGLFYALAPVVFVGGSLTPRGGHNPLEPAHFDCAIVHGPDMTNNPELGGQLAEVGGAVTATDVDSLVETVERLLADPTRRIALATAASGVVRANAQVLGRTADALEALIARP
jgi:3-deoxy-D-manno-octulosonic-acid transferase